MLKLACLKEGSRQFRQKNLNKKKLVLKMLKFAYLKEINRQFRQKNLKKNQF